MHAIAARLPSRTPSVLSVIVLLLLWGGCNAGTGPKRSDEPIGDATLHAVLSSPWGRLLDEGVPLERTELGWGLDFKGTPRGDFMTSYVPATADGATTIVGAGERTLRVRPIGRGRAVGESHGNAVVYRGVRPGEDVVSILTGDGVEELVVWHDSAAARPLEYAVDLPSGASMEKVRDGGYVVFDDLGRHFARLLPAAVVDAAGNRLRAELEMAQGPRDQATVHLTVDAAGATFPVTIDPSWSHGVGFPKASLTAMESVICEGCNAIYADIDVIADGGIVYLEDTTVHGTVAGHAVELAGTAVVTEDVYTNDFSGDEENVWEDLVAELSVPLELVVPTVPTFTHDATASTLTYDTSTSNVAPAIHGDVVVDEDVDVELQAGVHTFRSLFIDNNASLTCAGPCELRVTKDVEVGYRAFLGHAQDSSKVWLYVLGNSTAYTTGIAATTQARVFAPNGTIQFSSEGEHAGRFVAANIYLGSDETINGETIDGEPDCPTYCDPAFALSCAQGPASVVACIDACEAALVDPFCGFHQRTFVDCFNEATTSLYCLDGVPMRTSCESVASEVATCASACSESDDENDCTDDYCDCPLGSCGGVYHVGVAGGTACDDGNLCTEGEVCDGEGSCVEGSAMEDDNDPCTDDYCDPATGNVTNTTRPDGSSCDDDGDVCDGTDYCQAGSCVAGTPLVYNDGDPCTIDSCDPILGVINEPDATYDDGDFCTQDVCGAGTISQCSAIDATVSTRLAEAVAWIYEGDGTNPAIQTGVTSGAIDPDRVAVIRGQVFDQTGKPIANATVEAVDDSLGYGTTITKQDGWFDYVVNGGGRVPIRITFEDKLEMQRRVKTRWGDYTVIDDVVLIEPDAAYSVISIDEPYAQTHVASQVTDSDGTRTAKIVFPADLGADFVDDEGTPTAVTGSFTVRATEYTVGDDGFNRMPADLPPESGYTYAVELSVDELPSGAVSVDFSKAVPFYVDNLVGIPVGMDVPSGYYDRQKARWIASDDGRCIAILGIDASGKAMVDIDGDESAESEQDIVTELGVDATDLSAELVKLAVLYPQAATQAVELWRVPVMHFTSYDLNLSWGPAEDDLPPFGDPDASSASSSSSSSGAGAGGGSGDGGAGGAGTGGGASAGSGSSGPVSAGAGAGAPEGPLDKPLPGPAPNGGCTDINNSSVECIGQVLHEWIDLPGTPFRLHYASDRAPGRKAAYALRMPLTLTAPSIPSSLKGIELTITVAGKRQDWHFDCEQSECGAEKIHPFVWDGLDAYGRTVQGRQPVHIAVGYSYDAVYLSPPEVQRSFMRYGIAPIVEGANRRAFTLWRDFYTSLGTFDARGLGLGGWSLDVHHVLNPKTSELHFGDGTRMSIDGAVWTLDTIQVASLLIAGEALDVGRDGSIYYVEGTTVHRRKPDGTLTAHASCPQGVLDMGVSHDGAVYLATTAKILRVDSGTTVDFAGGGGGTTSCPDSDGTVLATSASLSGISNLAVAPNGDVVFFAGICNRILRVDGDGYLHLVAGGGSTPMTNGSEVKALALDLQGVGPMAFSDDGTLYFYEQKVSPYRNRVIKVGADGLAHHVAGDGATSGGADGNGGLAVEATLATVHDLAVDDRGLLLVTNDAGEPDNSDGVRLVNPEGVIRRVAGFVDTNFGCDTYYCGDDGDPALRVQLLPRAIALRPGGDIVIFDQLFSSVGQQNRRLLRLGPPALGYNQLAVPSRDGRTVYRFDDTGRHLDTLDAVTGTVLYDFDYDATTNRLTKVTHLPGANGLEYVIHYDGTTGDFDAINAPYGRDFPVTLDGDGYLATLSYPTSPVETYTAGYWSQSGATGLLTSFQKPEGNASSYAYEWNHTSEPWLDGLLKKVTDPLTNEKTFTRTADAAGVVEVELDTPEGLKKTYWYGPAEGSGPSPSRGDFHNAFPGATVAAQSQAGPDGTVSVTQPSGTVVTKVEHADPRLGAMAPVVTETITTPGTKQMVIERARSFTLSGGTDPIANLETWTEIVKINDREYETLYTASSGTWVTTTPEGRKRRRTVSTTTGLLSETTLLSTTGAAIENATAYTYDGNDRLYTSVTGTGGAARTTTYGYDTSEGWLKTVEETLTDTTSQTTTYDRDGAWRVIKETRPDTEFTQQAWDKNGNLVGLTPPGKPEHLFTYTDLDQRDTYEPPDLGTGGGPSAYLSDWDYDDDRRVSSVAHPDFDPLVYTYGATTGWLEKISANSVDLRVFDYFTTSGQLKEIETIFGAGDLLLSFGYDGHLPTTFDWVASGTTNGTEDFTGGVELVYDDNFWVFQEKVDDGTTTHTIELRYDDDGLPTVAGPPASIVSDACSSSETDCLGLTWDADTGRLDGTEIGVVTDEYTYSDFGEIESYVAKVGGTPKFSYTIDDRDGLGRITQKTEIVLGTTTVYQYVYDAAGRLEEVWSGPNDTSLTQTDEFGYDDNGNRTHHNGATPIGVYDDQDRIESYDGWTYTSNDRGDVISKEDDSTSDTFTYGYDHFGALVSVTKPNTHEILYRTDGRSRRVMRLYDDGSTTSVTNTWLWRDQLRLAAELNPSGALKARYVSALGRNVPEVIFDDLDGTLVTKRLITDHLGSVRMVIDTDTGTVLQTHSYSAFGVMSGDAPGQPFGFAGGLYDSDTSIVRLGERGYDPAIGRWQSRDSIYFDGGSSNLYVYANGDPVNKKDSSGRSSSCPNPGGTVCQECICNCIEIVKKCRDACNKGPGMVSTVVPGDDEQLKTNTKCEQDCEVKIGGPCIKYCEDTVCALGLSSDGGDDASASGGICGE